MNKKLIALLAFIAIIAVVFFLPSVGAHHKTDHNPPGHEVKLPEQVCNENPSQEHNPHCEQEVQPPVDEEEAYIPTKCQEGSYSIGTEKNGDEICKLNPTGCPYGDSIPLGPECDKHKPVVESTTSTPVEAQVPEGK
jgi:hypothetical protein